MTAPDAPTDALPGTHAKLAVMAQRAQARLPLFHPGDARVGDVDIDRHDMQTCSLVPISTPTRRLFMATNAIHELLNLSSKIQIADLDAAIADAQKQLTLLKALRDSLVRKPRASGNHLANFAARRQQLADTREQRRQRILTFLADYGPSISQSIAEGCGIDDSRILSLMQECSWFERDPETRRWNLTPDGRIALQHIDKTESANEKESIAP